MSTAAVRSPGPRFMSGGRRSSRGRFEASADPGTIACSRRKRGCNDVQTGGAMYPLKKSMLPVFVLIGCALIAARPAAAQKIDLSERLTAGKVRIVNREAKPLQERNGIHVAAKPGNGVVWIEGSDFKSGTIQVDLRGRDVLGQSFVGLAFHRKDDATYEAVYLRPFNFRAEDPVRRQHAVQYISVPDYDWPRLRKEFPEEFENPVDQSIVPTDWVRLRLVVDSGKVQIYVGDVKTPALEVRKLGSLDGGMIGLWTGNNSEGDFANLVITPGT
jgi:hypothetical protein